MEGLKKRAVVAVVVLLGTGVAVAFSKRAPADPKTESWMVEHSPKSFGKYRMMGGAESPDYTYKMDEVTYKTLDPYGIVARIYEDPETGKRFDVVLIASRSKDSFHDPRVCFSAQGWALANQWSDTTTTKSRGTLPVTIALMDGPDGRNRLAAFLYRGPGGFYANTQRLKFAMLMETLFGGQDLDGVFYRIIPQYEDRDQNKMVVDLKEFIGEFMDAANAESDGYF